MVVRNYSGQQGSPAAAGGDAKRTKLNSGASFAIRSRGSGGGGSGSSRGGFAHSSSASLDEDEAPYKTLRGGQPVHIHPSSVLFSGPTTRSLPAFVVYSELLITSKQYMRGVTAIEGAWLTELVPEMFRGRDDKGSSLAPPSSLSSSSSSSSSKTYSKQQMQKDARQRAAANEAAATTLRSAGAAVGQSSQDRKLAEAPVRTVAEGSASGKVGAEFNRGKQHAAAALVSASVQHQSGASTLPKQQHGSSSAPAVRTGGESVGPAGGPVSSQQQGKAHQWGASAAGGAGGASWIRPSGAGEDAGTGKLSQGGGGARTNSSSFLRRDSTGIGIGGKTGKKRSREQQQQAHPKY